MQTLIIQYCHHSIVIPVDLRPIVIVDGAREAVMQVVTSPQRYPPVRVKSPMPHTADRWLFFLGPGWYDEVRSEL